ncbi:serine/threonine protein phosphatase PrpC [Pseudarthrobacter sp. PvP004]|jgi:protein phosphatase|uniref:PPM-type phosphatase domain-containing protein n=1 Tax=Paenarthrobacter aurescens (strain TC1) TaxID=290340 RepID=A1R9H1_PAEAT|nr:MULTISPECIES: protein phosphatase 2C domain-containing protein [Micrococcaceae]ABM10054.1 conserved hypothetical protein [Paenarthrobacter aurescens TC1]MBP2264710.1 serine/threonine protein phosphatase PrpC [Pseudarthrobacter sp. PvP004]
MSSKLLFQFKASQLTGPRQFQNDSFYVGKRWLVVADGAGSHASARDVADRVVDHYGDLAQTAPARSIGDALASAPKDLGTTLSHVGLEDASTVVAALLDDADQLWLSSVGDSRLLVVREGQIIATNALHNAKADFLLAHNNTLPPFGADAVLTRYIAAGEGYPADTFSLQAQADDVVLLLSDGVEGAVDLDHIRSTVEANGLDAEAINRDIMATASKNGLVDNATCVVARITRG